MGNHNCRASHAPKTLIALLAVASLVACEQPVAPEQFTPPLFGFGNGAPTGAHYNLNWIGVPQGKNATTTNNNGHVIFVALVGNTEAPGPEVGSGFLAGFPLDQVAVGESCGETGFGITHLGTMPLSSSNQLTTRTSSV